MVRSHPLPAILVVLGLVVVVAAVAWVPRATVVLSAMADRSSYHSSEIASISVRLAVTGNVPVTVQSWCGPLVLGFLVLSEGGDILYHSFDGSVLRYCPLSGPPVRLPVGWTESQSFSWSFVDEGGHLVPAGHTYPVRPQVMVRASVEPITLEALVHGT